MFGRLTDHWVPYWCQERFRKNSKFGIPIGKFIANLTIKNLPDEIQADLKDAARTERKSLNAYIISLLELSTDERWRRRMMREQREPFRKFVESLPKMADSTSLLRADRERGR